MTGFILSRHGRFWAVRDAVGELICLCVYKRGAVEVIRRLEGASPSSLRETAAPWPPAAPAQISMDSLGHSERSTVARLTFDENAQQTNNGETHEEQNQRTEASNPEGQGDER